MAQSEFMKTMEQNEYFKSLPPFVQENIVQGGVVVNSEEDLRRVAEHLLAEPGPH
ncbi:MAG TPA: hypothetical protein IAB66_02030 [Candidatus Caccousia avistercoris]|nr:hypothetical protein [Candidatus Caccousia avistercoris]